jgi:multidrug efflux pump subunit AcrA (membrane-fusion protein)
MSGPLPVDPPPRGSVQALLSDIRDLRHDTGPDEAFWAGFVASAVRLCRGVAGAVLVADGEGATTFRPLAVHAEEGAAAEPDAAAVVGPAGRALANGFAFEKGGAGEGMVVAVALDLGTGSPHARGVCVVRLPPLGGTPHNEALIRLQLVADVPASRRRPADAASAGATSSAAPREAADLLARVLDLLVILLDQRRFKAAAVALCNEVAARFDCTSVALGWRRGSRVRIVALSHIGRFEQRTETARDLEAAMEEAADQDETILWPPGSTAGAAGPPVTRAHEVHRRRSGASQILSLPMRVDGRAVAVLVCERLEVPFGDDDLRALHLVAGRCATMLDDLRDRDRWFGARAADGTLRLLRRAFGVERVGLRLAVVAAVGGAAVVAFAEWPHRVDAPGLLKTEHLAQLTAPFDGHIEAVAVRVGDAVAAGQTLLSLDRTDLRLREAEAAADVVRFARTAEKARAQLALADMRIAEAQEQQARAQVERSRHNLAQAVLASPIAGIVVEGDRRELLGAPVRKGEVLYKVAHLEGMFVEIAVPERDIDAVAVGQRGAISFLSRPELTFPVTVARIDPVAQVRPDVGNAFLLRAEFDDGAPLWGRPGMSGLVRIDIEQRPVWWILSHRTVDYLRFHLWW